ncbi:MAG TPA: hypothetical protein VN781_10010 [Acidimicrobiales bacterium]|nr:hypothetical protein [Acidimicrobiales bacterium]
MRRIAMPLIAAGIAAAVGWPMAAFAYGPHGAVIGTGTAKLAPCGTTLISGQGFQPDESVLLILAPGPVSLGPTTTGGDGSFFASLTIPVGTASGKYTVVATGQTGDTASTDFTVGKGGCTAVPLLSHSTVDPGESTVVRGGGCPPNDQVVLTLDGKVVGQTTANDQGMFAASIIPHGYKIGQETVTVECGSRSFGVLLSVVATVAAKTPESTTAVFGVFVLLGLVLLWGQFGSGASRRRRKRPAG